MNKIEIESNSKPTPVHTATVAGILVSIGSEVQNQQTSVLPEKIQNIVNRILGSEKEWKALYMGSWGCVSFYLEPCFKNTPKWEVPLRFNLPASKKNMRSLRRQSCLAFLNLKIMNLH